MTSYLSFIILIGAYFFTVLFSVLTLCSVNVFQGKIRWLFRAFLVLVIVNSAAGLGIYADMVFNREGVDGNIIRLIVDYANTLAAIITIVAIRATAAISRNAHLSTECKTLCTNYRKSDTAETSVFDLRHLNDKEITR